MEGEAHEQQARAEARRAVARGRIARTRSRASAVTQEAYRCQPGPARAISLLVREGD